MVIKEKCPVCSKLSEVSSERFLPTLKRYAQTYVCGHTFLTEVSLSSKANTQYSSFFCAKCSKVENECSCETGFIPERVAYEFQKNGVQFCIESNYNCLIADDTGLGKTCQASLAIRSNFENLTPVLIVQKGATTYQWVREFASWAAPTEANWLILGSKDFIPPGLKVYTITHDLLSRKGILEKLLALNITTVIVDECQSFKETDAKRTVGLMRLIKEGNIKHKIFLSGSPIKNRADEFFPVLNMLSPQNFPTKKHFQLRWLYPDGKGSYSRIAPWKLESFKELTARWIIRREKKDVLTDLPSFSRNFLYREIEDPALRDLYNSELDLFSNAYNSGEKLGAIGILGYLAKLRRITAMAKIPSALELAREFLDNTEDKLAIGIHHEGVRDSLFYGLSNYGSLKISGEDSPAKKDEMQNLFNDDPSKRVCVVNMLAGGVGLNLQKSCANAIVLERQWNFVDEKQFEDRFYRNGQTVPVIIDYVLAAGTIDQYFTEMVERKRKIFEETMGSGFSYTFSSDQSAIKELAETVLNNPLR